MLTNIPKVTIIPVLYRIYKFLKKVYRFLSLLGKYKQPHEYPFPYYATATLIRFGRLYMKHRLKLK